MYFLQNLKTSNLWPRSNRLQRQRYSFRNTERRRCTALAKSEFVFRCSRGASTAPVRMQVATINIDMRLECAFYTSKIIIFRVDILNKTITDRQDAVNIIDSYILLVDMYIMLLSSNINDMIFIRIYVCYVLLVTKRAYRSVFMGLSPYSLRMNKYKNRV